MINENFVFNSAFDLRSKGFIGVENFNFATLPKTICGNCDTEEKPDKDDSRYMRTAPALSITLPKSSDKCDGDERICTNTIGMNTPELKGTPPVPCNVLNRLNSSKFVIPYEVYCSQLVLEDWFHGMLDQEQAEALLKNDGDFLVREASDAPNNFVLTALSSNQFRHFLLIDEESGVVRTKDRMFESISHFINYHCINHFPIISSGEVFQLKCAVVCLKTLRRVKIMSEA